MTLDMESQFGEQERRLLYESLNLTAHLSNDVQRHLKEGLSRRVLLIQANRLAIRQLADSQRKDALSTYECGDLNIHLNSFYVQMRGALDNLAWALHYQYQLLGAVNEDDFQTRARCQLLQPKFLTALQKHEPRLAHDLSAHLSWAADFRLLRDPVAHRIPLYAVPGVAGPEEKAQIDLKYEEAAAAVKAGDFGASISAIGEAHEIGRYYPVFAMSGPKGIEVRQIHPQVSRDQTSFLSVSQCVVSALVTIAA